MPAYSRNYPQTFTPDGVDIEAAFNNDDKELQRVYQILSNMGALQLFGAKRQSVLYGSTDANGNPNYLSVNGLQVSIDGASKPIYLAFANGFSDSGTVDLLDKISSLVSNAWTLPANQTCYLYMDKDVNTGLLSYGFSLLPDLYQDKAPDSPTLDQHWYNTTETKMYHYNGSVWENKQRVFIAKAVTDASTTTLTLYGFVSQAPLKAKSIIVNGNNLSYNLWQAKKTYAIGDVCYSPNASSYVRMECIVAGTSGFTEPTWPAGGQTVIDGMVTWIIRDVRADIQHPTTFQNLKIQVTSNTAATITTDSICLYNGSRSLTLRSINLTLNTGTVGANGLDTGTLAASSWYYLFVIYNSTTQTTACLMSLSSTAPTLPSGYTYFSRVGTVRVDSSKNLMRTLQLGNVVQYVVTPSTNTASIPQIASGVAGTVSATPTWVQVSVSSFVPLTARRIKIHLVTTTISVAIVAPNNSYGGTSNNNNPCLLDNNAYGSTACYHTSTDFILESMNIYWASNGSTNALFISSWEENL